MENQVGWHGTAPNAEQYGRQLTAMAELEKAGEGTLCQKSKKIATRESYGNALVELGKEKENLVVLDADLAGATKTGVLTESGSGTVS